MEKLTESEIYIIDSLFERKQIDRQRLIKAISILPEKLIGDVLNSLTEGIVNITSSNIKKPISTYILYDTYRFRPISICKMGRQRTYKSNCQISVI